VGVLNDEGHEVTVGRTGEIAVRSPITMQGHYRDPETTTAAFRDGGAKFANRLRT
jgi:non-ribosomal peptide synthetase component E (peptide arylation enzyme)